MTMLGCSQLRGGEEVNPSSGGPNCPTNRKLAGGHLTPACGTFAKFSGQFPHP